MDGYHSQDRLPKLRDKINTHHLNYLISEEVPEKHEIRLKLLAAIRDFLLLSPPSHKYLLPETSTTLHRSSLRPSFSAYKACQGWDALFKYAANLIAQPWRKEYKQINTYSGYYKHSIEANLDETGVIEMFEVMGYRMEDGGVLVLEGPVCPDRVTCVSQDALFAYVECQILNEIYDDIYKAGGLTVCWSDIIDFRDAHNCSPKEASRALIYNHHQQQQQQQHLVYGNVTSHAQQQLIDTDSSGGGGYYNNGGGGGGMAPYNGSNSKRSNGVIADTVQMRYDQQEYGNVGHAIPPTYSFPPLRHHTHAQYYQPAYDTDYYNGYNDCSGGSNGGLVIPIHQYYTGHNHNQGAAMMYPILKQPPPCCSGNGYMSVPSTTAIVPLQPPGNCLCSHSSIVPTAQLIDLDNSSQPQLAHDVPDGPITTHPTQSRMRNNTFYFPTQNRSSSSTTYINGNHTHRDMDQLQQSAVTAHVSEDASGERRTGGGIRDKEMVGGKGDRDLRVEDGSGTYDSWDYVYRNLESQGYNKDLGERGDILDRSGKRRIPSTKTAELPEKLNGLTISTNNHQKLIHHTAFERRNSDETQSSYYDNVPLTKQQTQGKQTSVILNNSAKSVSAMPGQTLMQQKMKTNKLSDVKAKVDSRRSVAGVDKKSMASDGVNGGMKGSIRENGAFGWDTKDIGAGKQSTLMNNGLAKKQTANQSSPPNTKDDHMTSLQRPLITNITTTLPHPSKSNITPSTIKPSTSSWECSSCTYINTNHNKDSKVDSSNICEMCAKSRDIDLLDTSMEIGGSQCVKCTLVNPKEAAVCQVCDNTLSNSPTYI